MCRHWGGSRLIKSIAIGCWICMALAIASSADVGERPRPTYADVSYGLYARNILDFWMANGAGPRPVVIYIHGGGWTEGGKEGITDDVNRYLEKGISYASINYRLSPGAPLPAPVDDAARAVQFIRSKASEWNVDKSRVALSGISAGACTAMWILLHEDVANPTSEDAVLRESTRVAGAVARVGIARFSVESSGSRVVHFTMPSFV